MESQDASQGRPRPSLKKSALAGAGHHLRGHQSTPPTVLHPGFGLPFQKTEQTRPGEAGPGCLYVRPWQEPSCRELTLGPSWRRPAGAKGGGWWQRHCFRHQAAPSPRETSGQAPDCGSRRHGPPWGTCLLRSSKAFSWVILFQFCEYPMRLPCALSEGGDCIILILQMGKWRHRKSYIMPINRRICFY